MTGDGTEGPWTVLRLIRWSAEYLSEKGVESGRLDAEHLLAHALGTSRLQLYLQFDRPLTSDELDLFRPLLRRRAGREPLQYIVGRVPFRELELRADRRALIPRPETEVLVDKVLDWARGREGLSAVDVGTGTGCIALSLLKEGPFRRVWGIDPSPDALALAGENASRVPEAGGLTLLQGEVLAGLPPEVRVDVVVSNPPYVRDDEAGMLAPEILDHEPHLALFAGADGLAVIRDIVGASSRRLTPGGLLALEVGSDQGAAVLEIVASNGAFHDGTLHRDLSGKPRIITAVRRDPGAST